jgi:hypothetical protein
VVSVIDIRDADLSNLASDLAEQIESFIGSIIYLAQGDDTDTFLSVLLLEVSGILMAGGRLGAIADIEPEDAFEPDPGPDADVDQLRASLAALLGSIDEYVEVFDPYAQLDASDEIELVRGRISDDLAEVITCLDHGLAHFRAGRVKEALWWWQFSYLADWGATAAGVLRALQSLIARTRLEIGNPL